MNLFGSCYGYVLVALLSLNLASSFSHAVEVVNIRLYLDGSVDPPGDTIELTIWREPADVLDAILVRAYLVTGERREVVERVAAQDVAFRDAEGRFELRQELKVAGQRSLNQVRLVIPYAALKISEGNHRIGYEIVGMHGDRASFVTATDLSEVTVTKQTRQTMRQLLSHSTEVVEKRRRKFYIGGPPTAKTSESSMNETLEMPLRTVRVSTEARDVAVSIPGGFERRKGKPLDGSSDGQSKERLPENGFGLSVPSIPASKSYDVQQRTIYFGTNRSPVAQVDAGSSFSAEISAELISGSCVVDVPVRIHRRGVLEVPSWWSKPASGNIFEVESTKVMSLEDIAKKLADDDILVFVHGFNNTFNDGVLRAVQFALDIQFKGRTIVYSWPSAGNINQYAADEEKAEKSGSPLAQLLCSLIKTRDQDVGKARHKIHLIAHSMGNRVALNALYDVAGQFQSDKPDKPLGQIILAAPDVGAVMFNNLIGNAIQLSEQVTYYYCRKDAALKISQNINKYEPIGLYPYFDPGLVTINADNVDTSTLWHMYFASAGQMLLDLQLILREGARPNERMPPLFGREQFKGHDCWTFPLSVSIENSQ